MEEVEIGEACNTHEDNEEIRKPIVFCSVNLKAKIFFGDARMAVLNY
jgi:hypothetical protein